jgi:hypothetical protein
MRCDEFPPAIRGRSIHPNSCGKSEAGAFHRTDCRASAPLAEPKPWQPERLPYKLKKSKMVRA